MNALCLCEYLKVDCYPDCSELYLLLLFVSALLCHLTDDFEAAVSYSLLLFFFFAFFSILRKRNMKEVNVPVYTHRWPMTD